MFWVMLYNHPEYNAKIRLMQALGPVARMDRTTCPLRIFAPYANELEVSLRGGTRPAVEHNVQTSTGMPLSFRIDLVGPKPHQ